MAEYDIVQGPGTLNAVPVEGVAGGTAMPVDASGSPIVATRPSGAHTYTFASVAIAEASVLAADANRVYLGVQNKSAFLMHIRCDGGTVTATNSIDIAAGKLYEPADVPTGQIRMSCPGGTNADAATITTR
jgi:hypothetical protein